MVTNLRLCHLFVISTEIIRGVMADTNKHRSIVTRKNVFMFCITALGFAACAPVGPVIEGKSPDIKVTVKSGGKIITNPEIELVHRVDIVSSDFKIINDSTPKIKALGFKTRILRDSQGGVSGILLDLRAENALTQRFGLQHGDLIMAIGGMIVGSEDDVDNLFVKLQDDKYLSVTVHRDGENHKILYSVTN